MPDTVVVIANGDLRLSANQRCWPAQAQAEETVMKAIRREGRDVRRGHACDPVKQHGFIDSQKYGMEVFRQLPPDAPLVV
ncbi:MAG: fucose isomerase, partial [Candidatus Solibacter sp.]